MKIWASIEWPLMENLISVLGRWVEEPIHNYRDVMILNNQDTTLLGDTRVSPLSFNNNLVSSGITDV